MDGEDLGDDLLAAALLLDHGLERDPLRGRGEDLVGRAPLLERCHQGEGLERGSRLPLALGGEVERLRPVVIAADHRLDAAGDVVEHDDGRVQADASGAVGGDLLHLVLEREVEGRGDLEAAAERLAGAVLVDQLLAQPGGEVGGPRVLDWRPDPGGSGQVLL